MWYHCRCPCCLSCQLWNQATAFSMQQARSTAAVSSTQSSSVVIPAGKKLELFLANFLSRKRGILAALTSFRPGIVKWAPILTPPPPPHLKGSFKTYIGYMYLCVHLCIFTIETKPFTPICPYLIQRYVLGVTSHEKSITQLES